MHTAIPDDELKVFDSLTDVKVVFDVGARDDVDYLILKPGIELHAFEPNQVFFEELKANVKDTPNVHLNNFGLGDVEGSFWYDNFLQTTGIRGDKRIAIKRLDEYVKEKGVTHIDFLKIDTEGYELNVLKGGMGVIKMCRYIQYEKNGVWDSIIDAILLSEGFSLHYIGGRNVLAVKTGEPIPFIPEIKEGGLVAKTEKNYL